MCGPRTSQSSSVCTRFIERGAHLPLKKLLPRYWVLSPTLPDWIAVESEFLVDGSCSCNSARAVGSRLRFSHIRGVCTPALVGLTRDLQLRASSRSRNLGKAIKGCCSQIYLPPLHSPRSVVIACASQWPSTTLDLGARPRSWERLKDA